MYHEFKLFRKFRGCSCVLLPDDSSEREQRLQQLAICRCWLSSRVRGLPGPYAGPNELSIVSPNAASIILGPRSQCMKSPWYDYVVGQSLESLHSTRDVAIHEARRRVWDRGFSMKGELSISRTEILKSDMTIS